MESANSTSLDEMGDKPLEPDHPMLMDGWVILGDTAFMVRCQIEDFLQLGLNPQTIENMAKNPHYSGLYASRRVLGDEAFLRILADAVQRIGVHVSSFQESETS